MRLMMNHDSELNNGERVDETEVMWYNVTMMMDDDGDDDDDDDVAIVAVLVVRILA